MLALLVGSLMAIRVLALLHDFIGRIPTPFLHLTNQKSNRNQSRRARTRLPALFTGCMHQLRDLTGLSAFP